MSWLFLSSERSERKAFALAKDLLKTPSLQAGVGYMLENYLEMTRNIRRLMLECGYELSPCPLNV